MKTCHHCGTLLFEQAKFCHHCGTRVLREEIVCATCQAVNPMGAKYCFSCGEQLFRQDHKNPARANESAPTPEFQDMEKRFFKILDAMLDEEHAVKNTLAFHERLAHSEFREELHINLKQLISKIQISKNADVEQRAIEQFTHQKLRDLANTFLIRYANTMLDVELPIAILKYIGKKSTQIDLYDMVIDFLDFDTEQETVYLDFIKMPVQKLRNASAAYLHTAADEKIFFICDQSLLGSSREGFAMTDKALYWKAHLQKPAQVRYSELMSVKREKDWLLINKQFFNANPSLNIKMMKLLLKLGLVLK